jgi:8-oxo-dGTP pyrophosphatase MutT (NUDIX family)
LRHDVEVERAGVLVVSRDRLALIERARDDSQYWVIPGGGIETGETPPQAARREAEEELGVGVELGQLRVRIDYRELDGSFQRQWYFDASLSSEEIRVVGPELADSHVGSYTAVWLHLDEIAIERVVPSAVAALVAGNRGTWTNEVVEIDETQTSRH